MHRYDLDGADRGVTTAGASDITMRIWNELDAAGAEGLTRDEILERVGPHINRGYARRRYLRSRTRDYERYSFLATAGARKEMPTWETTEIGSALQFIITKTLANMRRNKSVIRQPDGRYVAGRQPRHRDPSIIDMNGDRTRIHMNSAYALRVLEPAVARIRQSPKAQLKAREKEAFLKLVELHKEMLQRGLTQTGDTSSGESA